MLNFPERPLETAALRGSTRFVVVGAGVHGLSTAVHLAERLGSGEDVLVLDKQRVGAGASGISGGIVRNFYRSAAITELVRLSVEIFELDPALFGFRQVGYLAVVPEAQAAELEVIAGQQADAGYESTLVRGETDVASHLRGLFPDWRATGSTALLHERRGGWADASTTVTTLAGMARAAGVEIVEGVALAGVGDGVAETTAGDIRCETIVLAPGPWARELWRLAGLPETLELAGERRPPFHYWQVREGEYAHAEASLDPHAPVVHLDADVPVSDQFPPHWGIYFRPGLGSAVAAGGLPLPLADDCELDPYGPSHPELGRTTPEFDRAITEALAWALGRFEGPASSWKCSSAAAQTCFTPDSYPTVGWLRDGVYGILDSNHGFKLLALGKLAAAELTGEEAPALAPFRLERFAAAATHPASASPYPWN